jgi:hypothetical protein
MDDELYRRHVETLERAHDLLDRLAEREERQVARDPTAPDALQAWAAQMPKPEPGAIMHRDYEPAQKPKEAATATMSPEASRAWNAWAKGIVNRKLDRFATVIGEEVAKLRAAERKHVAGEIEKLRNELQEVRSDLVLARAQAAAVQPRIAPRRPTVISGGRRSA